MTTTEFTDRPCKICSGAGTRARYGTEERIACYACGGVGTFAPPMIDWLVEAITKPVKGTGKRVLKRSLPVQARHPKWPARRSQAAERLAYVHRMVEFHAGWDVRLPMCTDVPGDPFLGLLDDLAEELVRVCLGRSSIGRGRWQGAMTGRYGERGPGLLPTGTEGGFEVLTGAQRT